MKRDPKELVCLCQEVTLGEIKKAIQDGATTVDEVSEQTDAAISCGVCIEEIEDLLEEM